MASLQVKIAPLEIPSYVYVTVPGSPDPVEVLISELDEDTISELLEEFSTALLAQAAK